MAHSRWVRAVTRPRTPSDESTERLSGLIRKKGQFSFRGLDAVAGELDDAHELPGGLPLAKLLFLLFIQRIPPFVILLFQNQKVDSIAEKVQNTGVLHADAEEREEECGHQRRQEAALSQGQDREDKADPDDGHIPQGPQPQHGPGLQVFGVDIDVRSSS